MHPFCHVHVSDCMHVQQGTSMTHATPSSSAGLVPMAEDDGPGALEAVERLEGSPPLENGLQQPLHPHQEQHQGQETALPSK